MSGGKKTIPGTPQSPAISIKTRFAQAPNPSNTITDAILRKPD
jgi:hypothetical protein